VLDSAAYLFENVQRIGEPHFTPNQDDILKARLRTSGIVERIFKLQDAWFKIIDVGGQRNERRKWIHCFDNVTAGASCLISHACCCIALTMCSVGLRSDIRHSYQ